MPIIKHSPLRVVTSISLTADPVEVWNIITDTTQWPAWGPSVRQVVSEHRFIHSGCRGKVLTAVGIWLPFTITSYDHMHYWSWNIGPIPATGHQLKATGSGHCTLSFDMPWWAAPYIIVCRAALHRIDRLSNHAPP